MYVNLPDIIIVRCIEKPRKRLKVFPLIMGCGSGDHLMKKNSVLPQLFSFFSCQTFSPSPDIVRHGGMVMVEEITPPPPHYSRRDPLFTRENLLSESPIGLSSCSACISRANLAGWTVCPLGILTDEYKLHYLAFSFQLGYLCCVTKYISIWSHSEQQEKTYSGVETRILYSIYNLQKVRRLTVFVSRHSEKKQRNQNQGRRVTIAKGWGFFFWYS